MFDPRSRYADGIDGTYLTPDGRSISYRLRRRPPPVDRARVQRVVIVNASDRLDLLAARYLSDPEQFWRLIDANPVIDPFDLERPGQRLVIPSPVQGGIA